VTAKLRILTKPSPTPPMGQYYVEHKKTGTVATTLSSLAASNKSTLADEQPLEVYLPNKGATAAPPCTHFISSTGPPPNFCTDSKPTHPMMTLEKWEEWNRSKGISFGSKTSSEPGTYTVGGKKEETGEKIEVRQEGNNVIIMHRWT
jgi:hypothetical protein